MVNETELLQAVLEARQEVEKLEGRLAEVNEVKQKAESALIEYMDNRELKSFRSTALNCQVIRKETLYVSIDKERKEEAFRWITEDCGRSDMVKPAVHNRTLSSFIGDMLKKGEQIPQELFKWFFKPELTVIIAK